MQKKRSIVFGSYDTARYGWTLTGWALSAPEQKTNYIEKPGGDGSWDMSTVLTDGIPRYKDRTLEATFELSEGNRAHRERVISEMVNALDGLEWEIVLPDHPAHYLTGRVHIAENYSDLAHASVTVTATCAPWFYSKAERVYTLAGPVSAEAAAFAVLSNAGRRVASPKIVVTANENAADPSAVFFKLSFSPRAGGTETQALSTGTWILPNLILYPGDTPIEYTTGGTSCTAVITYREAVLR